MLSAYVRPSVFPKWKSPLCHNILLLWNFHNIFIPLKHCAINNFMKKRQPFFFSSFNTYLLLSVPYMKAWMYVNVTLLCFHYKAVASLICSFLTILTKIFPRQHFVFAFCIISYIFLWKLCAFLGSFGEFVFSKITLSSHLCNTWSDFSLKNCFLHYNWKY